MSPEEDRLKRLESEARKVLDCAGAELHPLSLIAQFAELVIVVLEQREELDELRSRLAAVERK